MRLLITTAILMPVSVAVYAGFAHQTPQIAKDAVRILKTRCLACHGLNGQTLADGVFVNSRAALVKSGKLIPGDINSILLKKVQSGEMPPPNKVGDKLPSDEIAMLTK